jgi:putative endonuclease
LVAAGLENSARGALNYPAPERERGEVPEWPIGAVSKTVVGFRPPWVRIPPSPPGFVFVMITVYILQDANYKRYVGITNNLTRRLKEHKSGNTKAGQLLADFQLLHIETFPDYQTARMREKYLKSGQGREWLDTVYPRSGINSRW